MVFLGFSLWRGDRNAYSGKIREIRETGFDYVEVSFDFPWPLQDNGLLRKIGEEICENGLLLAVHGGWRDVKLASPINEVREASLKYVLKTVEEAKRMEPLYMLFHMATEQAVKEMDEYTKAVKDAAVNSMNTLVMRAEELDIRLVFENVPSQFLADPHDAEAVFLEVGNARLCFDVGHAWMYEVRREENVSVGSVVERWFSGLGRWISGLHIYDCLAINGCLKEHILPGVDSEFLRAVIDNRQKYDVASDFVVVEAFKNIRGEDVKPSELQGVVELLRKGL
ncbi:MAG: sugar phosphate isomerase/epimerase [Aigarchaeota archaeon]|nr:sugar phosphate isomerase/epimerase [Candidatus Pelearchaeum maunauluense]